MFSVDKSGLCSYSLRTLLNEHKGYVISFMLEMPIICVITVASEGRFAGDMSHFMHIEICYSLVRSGKVQLLSS